MISTPRCLLRSPPFSPPGLSPRMQLKIDIGIQDEWGVRSTTQDTFLPRLRHNRCTSPLNAQVSGLVKDECPAEEVGPPPPPPPSPPPHRILHTGPEKPSLGYIRQWQGFAGSDGGDSGGGGGGGGGGLSRQSLKVRKMLFPHPRQWGRASVGRAAGEGVSGWEMSQRLPETAKEERG